MARRDDAACAVLVHGNDATSDAVVEGGASHQSLVERPQTFSRRSVVPGLGTSPDRCPYRMAFSSPLTSTCHRRLKCKLGKSLGVRVR